MVEQAVAAAEAAVAQAEGVRPEVAKHLKDASALVKGGKGKEALAKLRDAGVLSDAEFSAAKSKLLGL